MTGARGPRPTDETSGPPSGAVKARGTDQESKPRSTPLRVQATPPERHPLELALVLWLQGHTRFPEVDLTDFFATFGGERIPKYPAQQVEIVQLDILQACLASVLANGGLLLAEEAERIGRLLGCSSWHVRTHWNRYRRRVLDEATREAGEPPRKHN